MATANLDFYGTRVVVDADEALATGIGRDFSHFRRDSGVGTGDITIRGFATEPPWERAPDVDRSVVHPDFVAYDNGDERWVDYHGRALVRWDYSSESGDVWTSDDALRHEITYLLLLSRLGEIHDLQGIHRAHAVGLRARGKGILCFLPSGGGKTTLGLASLELPGVDLLSDDTPLVTRRGQLLAFPTRIGCSREPPPSIPKEHVRRFERRNYGTKWLIDTEAFAGRIAESATPDLILIGQRTLHRKPEILPTPRREMARELFRSVVVGYGLPQVVEFFLRGDLRDMARKGTIVASRSQACAALLARGRTYRFVLGRDIEENAAVLQRFLSTC